MARDKYVEACWFDAYGLPCEIDKTEIRDNAGNWDRVIVKFVDKNKNVYGLIEDYNAGEDNSTKQVTLEDNKTGDKTVYETYVEAELALVDLIRSR